MLKFMKKFRLLKATRQSTEYSCGASALQAVLSYWGKDLDEAELMKVLHTTPEDGTYPEDIIRVAHELGFETEIKENLTLNEVEKSTEQGNPVIVCGQAWRSREDSKKALTEDWEHGHYVVILAVDKDHVYFEDPYVRMGKGFMPRQIFEEHWHNIGGKTPTETSKQMHLGIFIRGEKPAKAQSYEQIDSAKLDFSNIAPLYIGAISFKGEILPYEISTIQEEVGYILESGLVRSVAFLLLGKDKEGRLSAVEGGSLQEEKEVVEINALLAMLAGIRLGSKESLKARARDAETAAFGGDFGLQMKDILRIGEELPTDSSALIFILEHLWVKKFKDILSKHGGVLVSQQIITADKLAALGGIAAEP